MSATVPCYCSAHRDGRLQSKAQQAAALLSECTLCPRGCKVNRTAGEEGFCRTGAQAKVASYHAHFGEEEPLVGRDGSGTIFFSHCNLLCNFCQNYEISHQGEGHEVTDRELAWMMLQLQQAGCHNINLVTPSHVVPQILSALVIAAEGGLQIPLVYNSSAYDSLDTLKILEDVIDIYLPDFKFWDSAVARQTCEAADYPDVARKAIMEMHSQVGELIIDTEGIASRGLLLRHLVLPQGLAGTAEIMTFIARQVSKDTYVNIMNQYRPCGQAAEIDALNRSISEKEYLEALNQARAAGITRLDRRRRIFMLY